MPKGFDMLQFPTRGGQSADIYNQLGGDFFQQLLSRAHGMGDSFQPQEQQAQDFYNRQLAPQIAQRYAGSGIGSSSGMQNALTAGATDLTSNLHAQRNQMMEKSIQDVLGLGNLLLSNPDVENYFQPSKKKGFDWGSLFGSLAPAAGGAIGGGLGFLGGGPAGALAGAGLGSSLGSKIGQGFR